MKLGASNEAAKDKRGATPLHYAIAQGRAESVKALLECGANVNCKGKQKREYFGC
jgi:ankyrin repeat protein